MLREGAEASSEAGVSATGTRDGTCSSRGIVSRCRRTLDRVRRRRFPFRVCSAGLPREALCVFTKRCSCGSYTMEELGLSETMRVSGLLQESCAKYARAPWWPRDRCSARRAAAISSFPFLIAARRADRLRSAFRSARAKKHRAPSSAESCPVCRAGSWARCRVCRFGERKQPSRPDK